MQADDAGPRSGWRAISMGIARARRDYGIIGASRLAAAVLRTKLIAPNARLMRFPVYIRNRRLIRFGDNFTSGVGLRIEALSDAASGCVIEIGRNVQVNDYVHIGAVERVTIGDNVLIASKVFISDHNHGNYRPGALQDDPETAPALRRLQSAPVVIEENVWIGEHVAVLPGVTIGRGAIIGALSVVSRDVPPHCIAAGAPARVLKRFDVEKGTWERCG